MNAQRRPRRRTGTAFATIAAGGVIAAALLIVLVLQLARSGTVKNQLGDKVFDAGKTADLAHRIGTPGPRSSGGPILLPALVGHRDIYLQHLGDDAERGWVAFDAAPRGEDRTCDLVWNGTAGMFRDPCRGQTYPADGAGTTHYSVTVDTHHHVIVDLRTPLP